MSENQNISPDSSNSDSESEAISDGKTFPIPLSVAWIINIVGWILFVSTFNSVLEIITGLLCVGCAWVGIMHRKAGTSPFLGLNALSASNLIWASIIEALWMFAWGFGLMGGAIGGAMDGLF